MSRKIYIAGPMTGYVDFNYPKFMEVEAMLRSQGFIVFNPTNKGFDEQLSDQSKENGCTLTAIEHGLNMRDIYQWDVSKVIESDAIYVLDGYENSPGAIGELAVARAMKHYYPEYEIIFE